MLCHATWHEATRLGRRSGPEDQATVLESGPLEGDVVEEEVVHEAPGRIVTVLGLAVCVCVCLCLCTYVRVYVCTVRVL